MKIIHYTDYCVPKKPRDHLISDINLLSGVPQSQFFFRRLGTAKKTRHLLEMVAVKTSYWRTPISKMPHFLTLTF